MNKELVIVETDDFGQFMVDSYDLIGNFIKINRVWEYHLFDLYSKMIARNYYCIDAGANIGFHTIQFGRLCNTVYAFEPQRYIFNLLSANILLNQLDNCIVQYRLALGNKKEIKQMWNIEHEGWVGEGKYNWGGRGIIQPEHNENYNTKNEIRKEDFVEVTILDEFNFTKCNLIKIDVQGYELNLLEGGKNLINTFYPTLFLENPINDVNGKAVKNLLLEWGMNFIECKLEMARTAY